MHSEPAGEDHVRTAEVIAVINSPDLDRTVGFVEAVAAIAEDAGLHVGDTHRAGRQSVIELVPTR
ncbi:MAG: hypothetical protein H0W01_05465 [Pseudonocardiales bacterium]|nr:hypothetical protein [Pseudonocardiales bacterium]